ncbi:MAG: S41 family peptidase [Candidatus Methylacidiphilales bacterium]|nr:S41 family peptidase [Candidatus Methylacidiphilales bacterium]
MISNRFFQASHQTRTRLGTITLACAGWLMTAGAPSEIKAEQPQPPQIVASQQNPPPVTSGDTTVLPSPAQPTEAELGEMVKLLKEYYADPSAVKEAREDKAALGALLQQLGGGVSILTTGASTATQMPKPMYTELLPQNVGYVRMPSFAFPKDRLAFELLLNDWNRVGVLGIILDLRDFEAVGDFGGAAQLLSFFTRGGLDLFTVQGLQIQQRVYTNERRASTFSRPVIVLVNGRTTGAGEVFAAVMRVSGKAIIMGRSTAGLAAVFIDKPLTSGRSLRLATGQALLADGTKLFGVPVSPDIPVATDDSKERDLLVNVAQSTAAKLIQELPPRLRLSEAALVREENPEYDAALAERSRTRTPGKSDAAPVQDTTLIRALDVLRAIHLTSPAYSGGAD